MGRYNKNAEIWKSGYLSKEGGHKCSFCEKAEPTAHWNGTVFCCRACALDILPAFIADATVSGLHSHADSQWYAGQIVINEFKATFWQAVASIFFHDGRKK